MSALSRPKSLLEINSFKLFANTKALFEVVLGSIIINSSPPHLPIISLSLIFEETSKLILLSTLSPLIWPKSSLINLKSSISKNIIEKGSFNILEILISF